jgi:shikimate kinase
LAQRNGWEFIDADALLETTFGKTIKQIFADEGEASFRDKEAQILAEVCRRECLVVGTGGGVILREQNRALLRASGFVVWLTADVATIAARLEADPSTGDRRPDLTTGGLAEIEQLLRVREPLYRQCADLEIDARQRSPEAIVEAILSAWDSSGVRFSG